ACFMTKPTTYRPSWTARIASFSSSPWSAVTICSPSPPIAALNASRTRASTRSAICMRYPCPLRRCHHCVNAVATVPEISSTVLPNLSVESSRVDRLGADLTHQIDSGRLPPGSKLPSDAELRKQYDVSQTTVRIAMERLRSRLVVEPGRGRYVADPPPK